MNDVSYSNAAGATPPNGPRPNGRGGGPKVHSGLAHRRNPLLVALEAFAQGIRTLLRREPFTTFLAVAAAGVALAFVLLLSSIGPSSSGTQVPISRVEALAKHKHIASATLLDHDNRVEVITPAPSERLWAAYPSSGAQTQALLSSLAKSGAPVSVDQQSGKPLRSIVVQFLLPILLLVCLFALFTRIGPDGGAGGIAGFSRFTGKGKRKGKGVAQRISFADVAGAGEAVAELREIRDYLAEPDKYLRVGAAAEGMSK
jgi:cell division protease FtsH